MAAGTRTIEIGVQVYELACRAAALDTIEVATYLESIVMRDAEHIRTREFVEQGHRRAPETAPARAAIR